MIFTLAKKPFIDVSITQILRLNRCLPNHRQKAKEDNAMASKTARRWTKEEDQILQNVLEQNGERVMANAIRARRSKC